MDDILITGSNSTLINDLIMTLGKEFAIHDLGHDKFFLGIELSPYSNG